MGSTYTGRPDADSKDYIRFLIGDTNMSNVMVSDEEINAMIATYPNLYKAASMVCNAIAAKFSRESSISIGSVSKDCSKKAEAYRIMSDELASQSRLYVLPSFGGLTHAQKDSLDQNTSYVQPPFKLGMTDSDENPKDDH